MSTSDKILTLRHEALILRKRARAKFASSKQLIIAQEHRRAYVESTQAKCLNLMAEHRDAEATRLADNYFANV